MDGLLNNKLYRQDVCVASEGHWPMLKRFSPDPVCYLIMWMGDGLKARFYCIFVILRRTAFQFPSYSENMMSQLCLPKFHASFPKET